MKRFFKSFYKIESRHRGGLPIFLNFLVFSFYQRRKTSKRNGNLVSMDFYQSSKVLASGHYKPISKIADLSNLKVKTNDRSK